MNSAMQSTFLFPGQGAYQPGALAAAARECADIDPLLVEIDSVARPHFGMSVRDLLLNPDAPSLNALLGRNPDALQMAIYAAAVATHRLLEAQGVRSSVLIGHSFGEIAALVCAGAFSVREGAHIVAQRCLALRPMAGMGYMAAVSASAERCAAIIQMLDTPSLTIAVENSPTQTVISGTTQAMDRMGIVVQSLGLSFVRLASAYPFHNALLEPAARAFQSALSVFRSQPLRVPVYSPILQRVYRDHDDLGAALSSHLTRPVYFTAAIRRPANVWAHATMSFVEMGASNTLGKLVRQILGDPSVPVMAPVCPSAASDSMAATMQALAASASGAVTQSTVVSIPFKAITPPVSEHAGATALAPRTRGNITREQLQRDIVALFAEAMEYPPEVFTEDVALEAELGIDSVKQMELLGKLDAQYKLPPRPDTFRLSDYGTLRKITDFVFAAIDANTPSERAHENDERPAASAELISISTARADNGAAARAPKASKLTRSSLQQQIAALFAEAMEYPLEVFTEDVELEAELGIDSVKQMELLGKLDAQYRLPPRPETFRLSDYGTLRKITDFVYAALGDQPVLEHPVIESIVSAPMATLIAQNDDAQPTDLTGLTRAELHNQIVALFAESMEYPPEVFTDDVALEAELGIDSVKQMELLGKLEAQYRLPARPEDFRLSDYGTLRKIVDFVHAAIGAAQPPSRHRGHIYAVG
jgi:acyl transferase domain-containing protein